MLTLTPTLLAAQQRVDVRPVVTALVGDVPPEVPRLAEVTQIYAGSEPDTVFDAGWLPDGSIARIYADASGAIHAQIVVSAGPGAAWSTWTTLDAAAYAQGGQVSPVALWCGQNGTVWAFWLAADRLTTRGALWSNGSWSARRPWRRLARGR